jgi:uncharacterized membrane protein YcaP (DUF421 family)
MDSVLRAVVIYAFLLVVFRLAGRRTLNQITTFDLVLLLIISEAVSSALGGQDHSLTNAFLLVLTLVLTDIGLSLAKQRWPTLDRWLSGVPLVIVEDGRPLRQLMEKARVDDGDVMERARLQQGLERMDQIKYAVLERDGEITIIPKREADAPGTRS